MKFFIIYMLLIGVVGVVFLCTDKYKATHDKWRIKERTLHILEFLGGIFMMLPAMYIIRHKCSKTSYNWISWTALVLWVGALVYFFFFRAKG